MLIRAYFHLVTFAAVLMLYWLYSSPGRIDWLLVLLLGAVCFVAEMLTYKLPNGGSVSLAFAICLAAILLGGPELGVMVAIAGSVTSRDLASGKPLYQIIFNMSQLGIAAAVAGSVYLGMGGVPLYFEPQIGVDIWIWLLLVLLTAVTYTAINVGLVVIAIRLVTKSQFRAIASDALHYIRGLLPLALLGLVIAKLVALAGFAYLVLLIVPFLVSRQTFMIYQQRQAAYLDTVRSLVAAIEVKDKYTSGHTERVAAYARAVCQHLGLREFEVQRIEWAALLHDIGKVIVWGETLRKQGELSDEEYCEIREHPAIAVEILEEVEFLRDVIPLIAAHHERLDGKGYPMGLKGDEIPLGARIIMVADTFDAITSLRPYRETLSLDEAIQELRNSVPSHLDPKCVEAFVAAINEGAIAPATVRRGVGEPANV